MTGKNSLTLKITVAVTFIAMVAVNALAQLLPINGVTPAQVSDSYPNLFAPAGLTFSIWGVIYLLLALYTLYHLGLFRGNGQDTALLDKTGVWFAVSSLANVAWIFSWHYKIIPLSMALMAVILISLIIINRNIAKQTLTAREKLLVRLPFSVYFGWITVATIANATVLLVSLGYNGSGIPDIWTVIVLAVGLAIGVAVMIKNRDAAYGLVLIWAYAGILIKHTAPDGFAAHYPAVIAAAIAAIVVFAGTEAYLLYKRQKAQNP